MLAIPTCFLNKHELTIGHSIIETRQICEEMFTLLKGCLETLRVKDYETYSETIYFDNRITMSAPLPDRKIMRFNEV